jgi:hypothetical protein
VDLLGKARRLESKLARTIDQAAHRVTKRGPREPLEVVHAIVDAVEHEVQAAGQGTRVFPFNKVKVAVVAPSPGARARIEAVFEEMPSLHDRIVARLLAAGCEVPGLSVKTTCVAEAAAGWSEPDFHIEFVRLSKAAQSSPVVAVAPAPIALTIVAGSAEQAAYSFALPRIDLGRCVEVRDSRDRLIRTNHVAFVDGAEGVNQSVSRRHAHIDRAPNGDYRVFDDRSAHGTAVLRGGRILPVPPGSRGVRLQPADEIALGEARLRVDIQSGR